MRFGLIFLFLCVPSLALAQVAEEQALMKQVLGGLQARSIAENREYCGYVGYDFDGALMATKARRGRKGSCRADAPDELETVLASYHTHGAYSSEYSSELPSGDDMEADEDEGIDGWVATPGGRLWFIDTEDMVASIVCDVGCLPSDPTFQPGDLGVIAPSYGYDELILKLDEE